LVEKQRRDIESHALEVQDNICHKESPTTFFYLHPHIPGNIPARLVFRLADT
jgi:hypothetical protein